MTKDHMLYDSIYEMSGIEKYIQAECRWGIVYRCGGRSWCKKKKVNDANRDLEGDVANWSDGFVIVNTKYSTKH